MSNYYETMLKYKKGKISWQEVLDKCTITVPIIQTLYGGWVSESAVHEPILPTETIPYSEYLER